MSIKRFYPYFFASIFSISTASFANKVTSVENNPDDPKINQEISLTFKFDVPESAVRCGLQVDWGDGESTKLRFGADQDIKPPFQILHTYKSAGKVQVEVKGVTIFRGLNSVAGCDANLKGSITVVDPVEVEKLAQIKAAEDAVQQAKLVKEAEEAKKLEAYKKTPAYQKEQALLEKKRIQEEALAKKAAEAEAKQKLANLKEFIFIKPNAPENTVDEATFLQVCKKTDYWSKGVYGDEDIRTIAGYALWDRRAELLISEGGADVKLRDIFVNKNSNCMVNFTISGVHSGTSVNLNVYCKVTKINKNSDGTFVANNFFLNGGCFKN